MIWRFFLRRAAAMEAMTRGIGTRHRRRLRGRRIITVGNEVVQAEFLRQFFAPLLYQSRRGQDKDALSHLTHEVFFDDETGFDGFTQSDFITQHAAPAKTAQGSLGSFDLIGEGIEVQVVQADKFVEAANK